MDTGTVKFYDGQKALASFSRTRRQGRVVARHGFGARRHARSQRRREGHVRHAGRSQDGQDRGRQHPGCVSHHAAVFAAMCEPPRGPFPRRATRWRAVVPVRRRSRRARRDAVAKHGSIAFLLFCALQQPIGVSAVGKIMSHEGMDPAKSQKHDSQPRAQSRQVGPVDAWRAPRPPTGLGCCGRGLEEVPWLGSNPGSCECSGTCRHAAANPALVVVLHACTQTAAGYDLGAGWSTLPTATACPAPAEQQASGQLPATCFTGFRAATCKRARGEAPHRLRDGRADGE